jgi:hypothetical protein
MPPLMLNPDALYRQFSTPFDLPDTGYPQKLWITLLQKNEISPQTLIIRIIESD